MEQNFSDDDIVDIVLTSFGVTRSLLANWLLPCWLTNALVICAK
jgi:hypothetical protein